MSEIISFDLNLFWLNLIENCSFQEFLKPKTSFSIQKIFLYLLNQISIKKNYFVHKIKYFIIFEILDLFVIFYVRFAIFNLFVFHFGLCIFLFTRLNIIKLFLIVFTSIDLLIPICNLIVLHIPWWEWFNIFYLIINLSPDGCNISFLIGHYCLI